MTKPMNKPTILHCCGCDRFVSARLTTAAPELLEYLQYAVWAHPELEKNEQLMAVIAKATAQQ